MFYHLTFEENYFMNMKWKTTLFLLVCIGYNMVLSSSAYAYVGFCSAVDGRNQYYFGSLVPALASDVSVLEAMIKCVDANRKNPCSCRPSGCSGFAGTFLKNWRDIFNYILKEGSSSFIKSVAQRCK